MSEKNKTKTSRKWLVSRLKTSGSKREGVVSFDYSDTRNSKLKARFEDLPTYESMSMNFQFYDGKINTDLLKRFLRTRVGQKWDDVYSQIIARIPTKLKDYKYCVYWYVADKVEIRDGKLWNLRENAYIKINNEIINALEATYYCYMEFYVDPESNELVKINEFESRKATKNMDKEELRKFREKEKKDKLNHRQFKKKTEEEINILKEKLKKISDKSSNIL